MVSLFSGCGGLDWGFHKLGFDILDVIEIDEDSCETYNYNFGTNIFPKDVREMSFSHLDGENIVVVSGPPCQDFSRANIKRKGIGGELGSLIYEFLRAVEESASAIFVFENVPGILSVDKGVTFSLFKKDLGKNYEIYQTILNFADYGIAQKRRRLFLVGYRREFKNGFLNFEFPISTHHEGSYVSTKEVLQNLPKWNNEKENIDELVKRRIASIPPGGNNSDAPKELQVKHHRDYCYRRLHPDKPAKTLIGRGGTGTSEYHYGEPRPLTNRERARLFGFSDNFVFSGDIGSVKSQICDAVSPIVSKFLAESVKNTIIKEQRIKKGTKE